MAVPHPTFGANPRWRSAARWPLPGGCSSMGPGPLRAETANATLRNVSCPANFSPLSPWSPSPRPARPSPNPCRNLSPWNRPTRANTATDLGGRPQGRPTPQPAWGQDPKCGKVSMSGQCPDVGSCIIRSLSCQPSPCCYCYSLRRQPVAPRLPATARRANPWAVAAATDTAAPRSAVAVRPVQPAPSPEMPRECDPGPAITLGLFVGGMPC